MTENQFYEYLYQQEQRSKVVSEWIEISEAPKDGSPILAYVPEPWHNGHDPIQVVVKWESRYGDNPKWICDCYSAFTFEPSHFQYLSNPPK